MATNPLPRTRSAKPREKIDWGEFVASLVAFFIGGWVFMLTVGVVHHEWLPQLPTLGYWSSLLIFFLLDWVVTIMRWHARTVPIRSDSTTIFPADRAR